MQRADIGTQPVLIATFDDWTEIYVQVSGAAAFYAAKDVNELTTPTAIPSGLQFTQASTAQPYKLTWIGPLWIKASAPGSAIEIASPQKRSL